MAGYVDLGAVDEMTGDVDAAPPIYSTLMPVNEADGLPLRDPLDPFAVPQPKGRTAPDGHRGICRKGRL